jgi:hypothetical protein
MFFVPLLAGALSETYLIYPLALAKRVSDPFLAEPIRKRQKKPALRLISPSTGPIHGVPLVLDNTVATPFSGSIQPSIGHSAAPGQRQGCGSHEYRFATLAEVTVPVLAEFAAAARGCGYRWPAVARCRLAADWSVVLLLFFTRRRAEPGSARELRRPS